MTAGPYRPTYDADGRPTGNYQQTWDFDISVSGINWNDADLYKGLLEAKINLYEDCDIDCQKKGSQLTIIAILNATSFGLVGLNALFMFIGAWRWRCRVCSVYCTMFVCLFQFAIMITTAVLLFTKYNAVCARSLTPTYDGLMWTMNDDFMVTTQCWGASIILLFAFACCGMCSAYRDPKA